MKVLGCKRMSLFFFLFFFVSGVLSASNCYPNCEIAESDSLEVSLSIDPPACNGYEGWVITTVSGGTSPYTYAWNTGTDGPAAPTIGYMDYIVTVTDAEGSTATATAEVEFVCDLQAIATVVHVSCSGESDGAVVLNYSGCVQTDVIYCLSGGNCDDSNIFSGLPAGTYTFLVSSGACSSSLNVIIEEPAFEPLLFELDDTNIDCNNLLGSIALNATGGAAPYGYAWSNGSTSPAIDSLETGVYTFTITDSNGCTVSDLVEITMTPQFDIGEDLEFDFTCPNNATELELNPHFESPMDDYVFEWRNDNDSILHFGALANLYTDIAGTYFFIVYDTIAGCSLSDSVVVANNINYNPDPVISNPLIMDAVNGEYNGSIDPQIEGGTPPYNYSWDFGFDEPAISGLIPRLYELTVLDDNACVETFSYLVESITSVSQLTPDKIAISPNPAVNKIYFDAPVSNVEILNVYNQRLITIEETVTEIDLSFLASGMYYVYFPEIRMVEKVLVLKAD